MKNIIVGFLIGAGTVISIPALAYWDTIDQLLTDLENSRQWVRAEAFAALTNGGTAISVRQNTNCPDGVCQNTPSWRVQSSGTHQWNDSSDNMSKAFGPSYATNNGIPTRTLFEFQTNEDLPLGITLNAKGNSGGSISITNETATAGTPCLVIRYENIGSSPIATIPAGCM